MSGETAGSDRAGLASLRALVRGRVQGVFYRAFVEGHAEELGLGGYVRNLPDGAVEVVAEGEREQLEKLVGYLKKGPPAARVGEVTVTWDEYRGLYGGSFCVRY
ncbi:MAG: acylphosphatase [Dehalococcoidales bacterium]|nr:acylphosphatase [Dehalococcoidales bacterium]